MARTPIHRARRRTPGRESRVPAPLLRLAVHVVAVAPPAGAGSRRGRIVVKDELVLVLLGGRLVLALELDALADPGQLATACARRPVRACVRAVSFWASQQ